METSGFVGHRFQPFRWLLERGRMQLFAQAIGERSALYNDDAAARAAGYRARLAPPTLLGICAEPDPGDYLVLLGIDPASILHAEQEIEYHRPVCAGDELQGQKRIIDIYEKKGGTLRFVRIEVEYRNGEGALVCISRQTIVVRAHEARS